jgi:hypothetical protein
MVAHHTHMRASALLVVALCCLTLLGLALTGGASADTTVSEETNVSLSVTENASFDSVEEIEAALEDGTLEFDEYMMVGETLVIRVESERLAGEMAANSGTPTERFLAALDDDSVFRLVQMNPSPNRQRLVLPFGAENTTVFRNESTVYLSVDTGAVTPIYRQDGTTAGGSTELRAGQQYRVQFAVDSPDGCPGFEGACKPVGPEIEFQDVEAELFGPYSIDSPAVLAPEETELSVKVNVEPEEGVRVRMHLSDSTTITKEPEPVSWSGFPGVKVDLGDVDPGTEYTLELVHDGDVVSQQNGSVEALEASLRNPNLTVDDSVRLNLTATLSHGGQVQVFNGTGTQLGFAWVSPGTTNVSIALAQAGDGFAPDELTVRAVRRHGMKIDPYPGDGGQRSMNLSATDWASVTQEATPTPTSATATPSPASQSSPTETPAGTPDAGDAADGQGPGFTVGVVLVSMMSVLVVGGGRAVRRGPTRDSAGS